MDSDMGGGEVDFHNPTNLDDISALITPSPLALIPDHLLLPLTSPHPPTTTPPMTTPPYLDLDVPSLLEHMSQVLPWAVGEDKAGELKFAVQLSELLLTGKLPGEEGQGQCGGGGVCPV